MHLLIKIFAASLLFTGSGTRSDRVYIENNGVVVIEAESAEISGNWITFTSSDRFDFIQGFSGKGCIRFYGNTEVSGPPDSPLTYRIRIENPGFYRIKMRALKAHLETGEGDKANDCYLKLVGGDGWLGEFTKFVLLADSYRWFWNVMGEPRYHEFEPPEYRLEKGEYEIQIAGRSKNFFIDKMILFDVDKYVEEEVIISH